MLPLIAASSPSFISAVVFVGGTVSLSIAFIWGSVQGYNEAMNKEHKD
jgi:hypothetical protein